METDEMIAIWFKFWNTQKRRVSFKDREDLESLAITIPQYRWLLIQYRKFSAYPVLNNFIGFAKEELRDDTVPENLACLAYLSNNAKLIEMANDMEANTSAFFPNEKTRDEAEKLRVRLKEALT